MNVLGVIFDNKVQWNKHIAYAISKSISAKHCKKLIKYFSSEEQNQIIITNIQSILFYNSEICDILNLHADLKPLLLSTTANKLNMYSHLS